VTLGRINRSSYFREGIAYTQALARSDDLWGASDDWTRWTHEVNGFLKLPWRQNLGARIGAGATSAAQAEHQFFVGGFDRVRGFVDSRFRGKSYWFANLEYRISSVDTPWFALQHTVFTDIAAASHDIDGLAPAGASSGMGLRIISPKINRFIIRVDYGVSWLGSGNAPLSFGVGQFF
jgi:outer membrane protein assembly factor BamA